jgi:hypothetical protein
MWLSINHDHEIVDFGPIRKASQADIWPPASAACLRRRAMIVALLPMTSAV